MESNPKFGSSTLKPWGMGQRCLEPWLLSTLPALSQKTRPSGGMCRPDGCAVEAWKGAEPRVTQGGGPELGKDLGLGLLSWALH